MMVQQERTADPRVAFLDARREEILDAARRAFIAHGFHAASMQQIAAESGVSAGNIYRYFPNKEALIASVCEGCDAATEDKFAAATEAASSPQGALNTLGEAVWHDIPTDVAREQTILNLEALLVAVRSPEVGEPSRRSARLVVDSLTKLVAGAQAEGDIDPRVDAHGYATMLYALVLGMQQLQLLLGDDAGAATVWAIQQRLLAPPEHHTEPASGA